MVKRNLPELREGYFGSKDIDWTNTNPHLIQLYEFFKDHVISDDVLEHIAAHNLGQYDGALRAVNDPNAPSSTKLTAKRALGLSLFFDPDMLVGKTDEQVIDDIQHRFDRVPKRLEELVLRAGEQGIYNHLIDKHINQVSEKLDEIEGDVPYSARTINNNGYELDDIIKARIKKGGILGSNLIPFKEAKKEDKDTYLEESRPLRAYSALSALIRRAQPDANDYGALISTIPEYMREAYQGYIQEGNQSAIGTLFQVTQMDLYNNFITNHKINTGKTSNLIYTASKTNPRLYSVVLGLYLESIEEKSRELEEKPLRLRKIA